MCTVTIVIILYDCVRWWQYSANTATSTQAIQEITSWRCDLLYQINQCRYVEFHPTIPIRCRVGIYKQWWCFLGAPHKHDATGSFPHWGSLFPEIDFQLWSTTVIWFSLFIFLCLHHTLSILLIRSKHSLIYLEFPSRTFARLHWMASIGRRWTNCSNANQATTAWRTMYSIERVLSLKRNESMTMHT